MPQFIEKINIITTCVVVPEEVDDYFLNWQSELNDTIAQFPGFISLEILSPEASKSTSWTLVQRFADSEGASAWFDSQKRKELFADLTSQSDEIKIEEVTSGEKGSAGVTEVIITRITPENKEDFKKWMAKVHLAESKFPGFRGMYVQAPGSKDGHWITLLQFDTAENLDKWLASDVRREVLKELDPLVASLESHRFISSFAGWFSSIAKVAEIPPAWKQAMLVLLVLFPIVMLEFRFLNPSLLATLNISPAVFIGNAISILLITWPLMPMAIRLFRFWLAPDIRAKRRINFLGTFLVLACYFVEIFAFWSFVTL